MATNTAADTTYGVKSTVEGKTSGLNSNRNKGATQFTIGGFALNDDQFLSLVLGGIGMILLMRRFFVYFALALTSGYLLYRGLGCELGQGGNNNSVGSAFGLHERNSQRASRHVTRAEERARRRGDDQGLDRVSSSTSESDDCVDEALLETFPASDPPATW